MIETAIIYVFIVYMEGGNLNANAIFKKILSLGYEFETSEIAKLSLHGNKKTFINSDIAPRVLDERINRESIKRVDDNYISVRVPIGVDLAKIEEEFPEEVDLDEMDESEREYYEEFKEDYEKNRMLEKWAKKENESYLDYFYEYRTTDNHNSVQFQVTNDLGETAFGNMLKSYCEDLEIKKNDMFSFKTNKGNNFDIKFTEEIATNEVCDTFSGVEFVITYYNPKKDNSNVIVDTFVDACSRIIDHFGNLTPIPGTLFIDEGKKKLTPVGYLEGNRLLYHKRNTNLYYMQTYDSYDTMSPEGEIKTETINKVVFAPQMTFRCKAGDAIDIMKEIMKPVSEHKIGKTLKHNQKREYKDLIMVENTVNDLFEAYVENNDTEIDLDTPVGQILKTYVFLIIYKLFMFFKGHVKILSKKDYLKDHLSFNSRHGNYELYERIKEIMEEEYELDGSEEAQKLFSYSEVFSPFFQAELEDPENKEDFEEDGTYKYGEDFYKVDLPETDENYGNPLYSVPSYFKYLETNDEDWLTTAKYDVFSTSFSLDGDIILIENRWFRYAISLYLRNVVDAKISDDFLRVKDMLNVVNKLYPVEKIRKMITLEMDPYKKKLVKKCKPGYYRNLDFECALTKRAKLDKRAKTNKKTRKSSRKSKTSSGPKSKSKSSSK
jgi:hypothetical protein